MTKCLSSLDRVRVMRGFTLIEVAIVMVIIGCLLGGLLAPMATQQDVSKRKSATEQLEDIRNALIGYVHLKGSLPCPASTTSNGRQHKTGAICSTPNGFVPYADLGIQGTLINGVLADDWQAPLRYRLTSVNGWQYAGTIPFSGAAAADLTICSASPCISGSSTIIASNIVAVVFSAGKDGSNIPATTSRDQQLNLSGGNFFISRSPSDDPGKEFDDVFIWLSQNTLTYEMSKAK